MTSRKLYIKLLVKLAIGKPITTLKTGNDTIIDNNNSQTYVQLLITFKQELGEKKKLQRCNTASKFFVFLFLLSTLSPRFFFFWGGGVGGVVEGCGERKIQNRPQAAVCSEGPYTPST